MDRSRTNVYRKTRRKPASLKNELYITASCVIGNNSVSKDGQLLLEDHSSKDALQFLINVYRYFKFDYPRFYKMDNLCKLGWLCAEVLQKDSGIKDRCRVEELCLVLCNASSSLDTDIKYYDTVAQMASPALFVYTLPNIVLGEISIRHGWKGENDFFITENFDPDFLHQQVSLIMQSEANKACICGWVELLGNEYNAALYLVEKDYAAQSVTFAPENILTLYQ